ncbi:MAG: hypothetical protein MZW92_21425 [Comamonadaceae bacterium]|nr:hypothetical protein [Comamonadaceae bacterium]
MAHQTARDSEPGRPPGAATPAQAAAARSGRRPAVPDPGPGRACAGLRQPVPEPLRAVRLPFGDPQRQADRREAPLHAGRRVADPAKHDDVQDDGAGRRLHLARLSEPSPGAGHDDPARRAPPNAHAAGAAFTVDCYYQRAVRYAPDDTVARALYAQFLAKQGRKDAAVQQLVLATEHAGDNPLSHFNIGLVLLDVGEYDRAVVSARRARDLGYPRTELVDLAARARPLERGRGAGRRRQRGERPGRLIGARPSARDRFGKRRPTGLRAGAAARPRAVRRSARRASPAASRH